jgi:hypothetical protein
MPTGAWRHRHPPPVPPGMVVVQPIGTCTPAEAAEYLAARNATERGDSPEAQRSPRPSRSGD